MGKRLAGLGNGDNERLQRLAAAVAAADAEAS